MAFIPEVGLRGVFTLKPPFDKLMLPNTVYTVRSIRQISDYLASNEDVLTMVYTDNGLTIGNYNSDFESNVSLISLQSDTGDFVIVPVTYVLNPPTVDGVTYFNYMIGVGLGAIPTELDLEPLKTEISQLVYEFYGITPVVRGCVLSKPVMISHSKHNDLETARLANKSINLSTLARLNQAIQENDLLRLKIAELENYIKTTL